MRVLHVTDVIAPRYGGVTTAIEGICRGLSAVGVSAAVLATDRDWPSGRIPREQSNPYIHGDYVRSLVPALWSGLGYAPAIDRHLERFGGAFDLIHIHGLYRYAQFAAARFARRVGMPYIISPHGALDPFLYNKKQRRKLKRIYEYLFELKNLKNAAAIHYTAEEERSLAEGLRIFRTPGFVVPLGFDLEKFSALPGPGVFRKKYNLGSAPVVLFCGRITPKKGLDLLIPAFSRLLSVRADAKLVIVGPDNEGYWRDCQRLVDRLGVGSSVVLTGMIGGADLLEAYVDADVLALLSYTENFGNVVVEAMLCGTAVLITDRVNIWREIAQHEAGMVVPCELEASSAALRLLIENRDERKRLGANGFVSARRLYGAPEVAHRLRGFYEQVIRDSGSRRLLRVAADR